MHPARNPLNLMALEPCWLHAWLLLVLLGVAWVGPVRPVVAQVGYTQTGLASYYADYFEGRQTASGERFSQDALTAAHLELGFGTLVRVTNLENNKQVVVRINDRGPYKRGRVIDVSRRAAEQLDMIHKGVARVKLEVVGLKGQRRPDLTEPKAKPEPTRQQRPAAEPTASADPKPKPQTSPKPEPEPTPKSKPKPKPKSKPKPKPKPVRAPLPPTPPEVVEPGYYTPWKRTDPLRAFSVQLGSFAKLENAYALLARAYNKKLDPVFLYLDAHKDYNPTYRVLYGDFDAQSKAREALSQLKAKELDGFLVNFGLPISILPGQPNNEKPFTLPGSYQLDGSRVFPTAEGAYGIQLGAFRKLKHAQKLVKEIQAKGYSRVFIQVRFAKRNTREYRVLVGIYNREELARKYLPELEEKGMPGFVARHL